MISLTFTAYLKTRLGSKYRFYRLFYNLVALATFIPLIRYSMNLKGMVLFRWEGYMTILQIAPLIIVLTLFISGGIKYDMLQLLGIRQIKFGKSHSTLSESGKIDTSGVLSITRHPWYLAVIIFVWVNYREMYISTLIVSIILTSYIIIGTVLEEKKLIACSGVGHMAALKESDAAPHPSRVNSLDMVSPSFSKKHFTSPI